MQNVTNEHLVVIACLIHVIIRYTINDQCLYNYINDDIYTHIFVSVIRGAIIYVMTLCIYLSAKYIVS